ncbi:MAG: hypothetical protein CBE00_13055 [Planctomycetaceae bacterium TMED240]|nr:MAG: hypothetical protein CBE00_13055 [Planctomycetaceae bacterium TMED240]
MTDEMDDELWELTFAEFDEYLGTLKTRELQREAARAISTMPADNNSIHKFNKEAHHNSHIWYKAVIKHYVFEHGGMPSEIGPGKDVKFVLDE